MKNEFDVCVLGGGASGSMCAIKLAKQGLSVCVLDKNDFPAKKLLVTGNGRCNLTNRNMNSRFYNQNIDDFLSQFNNLDTIYTFNKFGLETYFDDEGRCYPLSNSAKSVCFVIKNQFKNHGIKFVGNCQIRKLTKFNAGYEIATEQEMFWSKYLIIATGGNFEIISMLENLGEKHKKFIPSLVGLKTKQITKQMSGLRLSNVKIYAKCKDEHMQENGEVLFKDSGLSGICVFNVSTMFSNHNFEGKLSIDIFPHISNDELSQKIVNKTHIFDTADEILQGMLPKEVCFEMLKRCNIKKSFPAKKLNKNDINNLVKTIKSFDFDICGCYENNQVFSGGIILSNLTENLESRKNRNMFFCGEICDVVGICGGYNLQWAFTSANVVANCIANKK